MKSGSSLLDITPPCGTHLGGTWGMLRKAETVAEPLSARALVLECGGHEIRKTPAKWAKLEPGSLEVIVENAVAMLKEIFA